MEKEFSLDLNKINLFGWEDKKSERVIDYLVYRIGQNDELPLVDVLKVNETTYILDYIEKHSQNCAKGGHHRTLAYYITNRKLRCRHKQGLRGRMSEKLFNFLSDKWINIKDIAIVGEDDVSYMGTLDAKSRIDINYQKEYPYNLRVSF